MVLEIVVDQLQFTIAIDKSNRAIEWMLNRIHRHNITNIPSTAEAATTIRMRSRAIPTGTTSCSDKTTTTNDTTHHRCLSLAYDRIQQWMNDGHRLSLRYNDILPVVFFISPVENMNAFSNWTFIFYI
jgi:hypothetical protein